MKPDKIVCQNCGKQINRGKWCDDKCRMEFKRKANKVEQKPEQKQPEQIVPEQKPEQVDSVRPKLTKTDKTFYDRAMKDFGEPYYNFDDKARELKCAWCGTKYTTHLGMNRYCSYAHYKEGLTTFK